MDINILKDSFGRQPKSNISFWQKKVEGNILRDKTVGKTLRAMGVAVIRIFEHSLKDEAAIMKKCSLLFS